MAFALTYRGLQAVLAYPIFVCHRSKQASVLKGEYGLTRALLKNGLNIDTLLLKYGSINWLDKKNWACNKNMHPTRKDTYIGVGDFKMTVHPLESVFYKPSWLENGILLSEQYLNETISYMDWAIKRKY
jgi:hypothetical protein